MAEYYLIRGNQIISELDISPSDAIALPVLGGGDDMSLLSKAHAQNLMGNLNLTAQEALDALGLSDLRSGMIQAVFVGKNPVSLASGMFARHLIDVGDYGLYQVDGQQDDLLSLYDQLWETSPVETLGVLAVVKTFGTSFYDGAVRTATGMTNQQAIARRDRVASYLENLGHTNTGDLRNATTEHDQMIGIAAALGFTDSQLWGAMSE